MNDFLKFLLFISLFCFFIAITDSNKETYCMEEYTVEEIIELAYRDAYVRISNDTIIKVNQASLKVGDSVCLRHERR